MSDEIPLIENGQTTKQPVVFCCQNPDCKENKFAIKLFEFESEYPECPKCGSTAPTVYKRTLIHLLVKDRMGPIRGQYGRWKLACDAKREILATPDNGESATDQLPSVNCPGCLEAVTRGLMATPGAVVS